MPELPDVVVYVQALDRLLTGRTLERAIVRSPGLLRTFRPDLEDCVGRKIVGFGRCAKRILWHFEGGLCFTFHLMIAGRFHWKASKAMLPKSKSDLAAFQFEHGTMMLTEAGSMKRAGLWVFESELEARQLDAGGINVLTATDVEIQQVFSSKNSTIKRALADPSRFDGIGNAYSDEILHAARLSPMKRVDQLNAEEIDRLIAAMRDVLVTWIDRLQCQVGERFPEKVTAFRAEMAVHGKFGEPCPICDSPVQRIRYSNNECNYCPGCQTDGRILADRSLSRLLKDEWPKTLEDLE